jgi:hypothetical protein
MQEYGPSNWADRPEEERPRVVRDASPQDTGARATVIWDSRSLMEEQVFRELDESRLSPDALLGLAWKVRTVTPEFILDHEDLIRYACAEFLKLDPDDIRKSRYACSRITNYLFRLKEEVTDPILLELDLLKNNVRYRKNKRNGEYPDELADVLYITAELLDRNKRRQAV